jgi:hypothetical protein
MIREKKGNKKAENGMEETVMGKRKKTMQMRRWTKRITR